MRKGKLFFFIFVLAVAATGIYLFYNHPSYFDFILKPTAREILYRDLTEQEQILLEDQKTAALKEVTSIGDGMAERVSNYGNGNFFAGYRVELKIGENLKISIQRDSTEFKPEEVDRLLVEIYHNENLEIQKKPWSSQVYYDSEGDETITVVIQYADSSHFESDIIFQKQAEYTFPLAEKDNDAIQSFWGASRGGGSRSHEGIDIFAPRDHPIVAVTDGRISSVRDRGLGGKQIWQTDSKNGQSIYYAHLNGWNVEQGDRVRRGDTIGYVGNTGNARTTPPHLHFGIYKSGGAIDPLSFVYQYGVPEPGNDELVQEFARANGNAANLRTGPSTQFDIIQDVKTEEVKILGRNSDWYHVRTLDGKAGFIHKSVLVF
ncbi:hypothetical protein BST97_12010 [Nonlabens spongiae]|uniref:SH3b domain-containing protein n=1 Tax=Nonlabens spongiae TaxID=331648 RepID=A0A1W6MM59_9FLAO|nr:M23 family metallopeptidase [Nonlabens spongiae]ARN78657.1 hypothetical protein BST97_12010 [Nonlabens spongiae]